MELKDLQSFGEPGAMVYLADCMDLMKTMPPGSVDVIFADPPYRLSNGGVTVKNGRRAPVDKGAWDRSMGFEADHRFNVGWLREARRILKPDGTIWVTGTHHIIFSLGFALQTMHFKLINQITWAKPDPPPNTLHTAFTHAHETLLWASKGQTPHLQLRPHKQPGSRLPGLLRLAHPGGAYAGKASWAPSHPEAPASRSPCRPCFDREGDLVFDPFCGSGTTGVAAKELGRFFVGAETEREYAELAARRIGAVVRGGVLRELPGAKKG